MGDPLNPELFTDALSRFATGVTLVTARDGRDDIGTTVSAFTEVSRDPPLVLVSLGVGSYLAEVLGELDAFAVSVLGADQRVLSGRFAFAGRPSARLLLAEVPHERGARTGALIVSAALVALECAVTQRVPAGDHLLVVAEVLDVPVVNDGDPLIRYRRRYLS